MEISFVNGFNVLSGETGSGKSAIMEGLKTLFGYKVDSSLIRHNCEKAVVEAIIDISSRQDVVKLLHDSGIDAAIDEDLILKRELSVHGKNRAFINHQAVQVSLLKKIGSLLFILVGQHANQLLFSTEEHRKIVDDYGNLNEEVSQFSLSFASEQKLEKELREWLTNEAKRLRELEICKMELTEFQEAHLKEGEEEELFQEYTLLSSSEERLQKANEVLQFLQSDKTGLSQLKRQKNNLEQLARQDNKTGELLQGLSQGICELEEVAHQLRVYISKIEADPVRLHIVNERLCLINKMRKKYGSTYAEIDSYFQERQKQLSLLEDSDSHILLLKKSLQELQKNNLEAMESLSAKRLASSLNLSERLTDEIRLLNMPKAEFSIAIEKREPSHLGQDHIEFFIQPNAGERALPIKDGASGGELARILLALKTVMAGKDMRALLVFDEVDANIGGATAAMIGEKLKELGKSHQVICITHFPQVAKLADHHLRIYKTEKESRTLSFIELLNATTQINELARMQGCFTKTEK